MEFSTETVKPVVPAGPYIGGKRNLAKRLCAIIDGHQHSTYAEPFVGMGGVFLRRSRRPRAEVINDLSEDVSTFFRILQRHYVAFMDMLRYQLTTRAGFERLQRTDPSTLTDLERAARFLFLQRTAFGGKVTGRNFGVSVARPGAFDVTKLAPILEELHERLAAVVIERLPYGAFIARYDRQETLFYLDPPYFGCEDDYGTELFNRGE
ncbi:MAG TPA: DNA adenine methylase, partial [Reyranellaceae bacterium]|nr:DNA adenine methylase [Reyranellaceae bacterium]